MNTMTKKDEGKRYWFECDKGRRWSECSHSGNKYVKPYGPDSKDGDVCHFSGCLQDHKIKLVKITEKDDETIYGWFKGWEKWEDCKASHPGSVYCDECDPDNVYPHKCHYSPESLSCFTCGKAFKFITINNSKK